MTNETMDDLEKAIELIYNDGFTNYDNKIWPRTNENLISLFSHFDVKGKDVFSVLGSSDQVFSARYLGAKSVDSFDINRLALYYYYLRTWLIRYKNSEYPPDNFCCGFDTSTRKFIEDVIPINEKEVEAKEFWVNYLQLTKGLSNGFLFNSIGVKNPNIYRNDLKRVLRDDIDFKQIDIFDEFYVNKKYDIVILSNILEYTTSMDDYIGVSENIKRLLKDDGLCICSYLVNNQDCYDHYKEVAKLDKLGLKVLEFNDYYFDNFGSKREVGYAYRKKR